ncbi:MAG: T9SS type A sorting domain-containing protein, partial [Phycisphaerae bacterium]|nr:T9SS type A sorting domain-containing protein [Saprospiraceae bacterium]
AAAESVKILSGGELTIQGHLSLYPSSEDGINNQGKVVNNGELKIGTATSLISTGIYNNSVFTNNGTIEIGKVGFDGIFSQGTFNNYGSIVIGAIGTIGQNGIQNNGSFSNAFDGYISIDHAGKGILNRGGGFANSATIDIGSIQEINYHITSNGIQNKASFINMPTGVIHIDRTVGACLYNEVGTVANGGTIKLASQMLGSQAAIVNLAGCSLTNDHCAILEANSYIFNKGTINNLGFFTLNNYGGLQPHSNTGTINNDGVLENIIGDAIPGTLVNHDMIIAPTSGECTIPNALQLGNPQSFSASNTWYFSEDLSGEAGIYNQGNNTYYSQGTLGLGENTVFFSITENNAGCSYTVSKKITLLPDHTPPVVACKQAIVEISASGNVVLDPALLFLGAIDDCGGGGSPVSVTPSTFNCAQIGQTVFATLTVSDDSGNTATCTGSVIVKDATAPTMLCKSVTINLDAAGQATLSAAQIDNGSYDNCAIVTKVLGQSTFNCANVGVNSVILGGVDASSNKGTCTATVTVKDAIIPVAKCKNITANLAADGTVYVAASTVDNGSTDNCSLTLSLTPYFFNCGNVGVNNVTLRAIDGSGNFSTCSATVTVKDVTAPNALCKNATVTLNDLGQGTLSIGQLNNGSSDACGIATMTLSKTQFNCSDIPGSSQSVTLTLRDVNNNQSSCTAQVTTKDNLVPTAICQNIAVQLGANGQVTVYPADLAANSFDNCSVTSYSPTAKVYTTANLGNNSLSITVKDWSGNGATCSSVVTVQPFTGLRGSSGDRNDKKPSTATATANLTLYPNPTAGDAMIDFELTEDQSVALRVFDLTGRMVLNQNLEGAKGSNQSRLEMATMPNGVYVVEIQAGDARKQKRLVVQAN